MFKYIKNIFSLMKGTPKKDGSGKGTNKNKGRGCKKATGKNQKK